MANFPGGTNALPGVYSEVITQSRGVSVPGGLRIAAIIGEGARVERLIASAVGGGSDGLNPEYTGTNGRDGRHFLLTFAPVITNRTTLFKNGIPLVGLEESFTSSSGSFSSSFDYRLDITNGHIELQVAALVDQGGSFYTASSLNVGNGTIDDLSLVDENAPTETWSIRCVSIRRDGYGNPVDGYAKFIAQGSISGIILDGYGNQITWQSNGVTVSNGILEFAISEGLVSFREGDRFTVRVRGGALTRGDSLTATYIAEIDLNDPEFFTDIDLLTVKHGSPSLTNRLSLGAQLAFANSPPGVYACQAAPAVPRRVSYSLEVSASGGDAADDLEFPLPLNVIPDVDSGINFFVTDPTTEVESQIFPNKVAFYDPTYTASPNTFHFGTVVFSYTVILEDSVTKSGDDGTIVSIGPTSATISSEFVTFNADDVGKSLKVLEPADNAGTYTIVSVTGGVATISDGVSAFIDTTDAEFEVIDDGAQSAKILFTEDLALGAGQSLRATVVDTRDADFFDVGWQSALEALERIECDIVVPLPSQTISSIFQSARIHCETMSNIKQRKERVLFIGAIRGLTPDNVIGTEPAAVEDIGILEGIQGDDISEILAGNVEDLTDYSVSTAFGNTFRVVYFYPDEIVVQIGADRVRIDGFFIAAAAAGFLSGIPNVAIPLTNKILAGFTILRDKLFRPIILENLAVAGITVLQPAIGGGTVIWGKTTTQSGFPEEEEISIVFIRDRISKSMRAAFRGFIGTAETPTLQGSLMARANSVLQSFVSQGLITAFRDLKVVRDNVDPRQWNITVAVQPVYPVNFIYIRVGIGLL
jgi:hypothetical protein